MFSSRLGFLWPVWKRGGVEGEVEGEKRESAKENFDFDFLFLFIYVTYFTCVKTGFGLDPKTGLDLGPRIPNNKFVERERKN